MSEDISARQCSDRLVKRLGDVIRAVFFSVALYVVYDKQTVCVPIIHSEFVVVQILRNYSGVTLNVVRLYRFAVYIGDDIAVVTVQSVGGVNRAERKKHRYCRKCG